jgi:hypothetical protein
MGLRKRSEREREHASGKHAYNLINRVMCRLYGLTEEVSLTSARSSDEVVGS